MRHGPDPHHNLLIGPGVPICGVSLKVPRLRWLLLPALLVALSAIAVQAAAYELDIQLDDDSSKPGLPLTPVHFNFTVYYNGTQGPGAVVFFYLRGEPAGWNHSLYGLSIKSEQESPLELWLVLYPEETAIVNLTVNPGPYPLAGDHVMSVYSKVEGEEHLYDAVGFTVVVAKRLDFQLDILDPPSGSYSALPGKTARVQVELNNTGNHADTYSIEATIKNQTAGWAVEAIEGLGPLGDTPPVPAFGTGRVTVLVSVPADGEHMDWRELRVTATSMGEPYGQRRADTVRVEVGLVSRLSMEVVAGDVLELDPDQGSESSWEVLVTNGGNGEDMVTGNTSFPGWSGDLGVNVTPEAQVIPPGGTASFWLNVALPNRTVKGIYVVSVEFRSNLSDNRTGQRVELKVLQVFGIELWCEEPRVRIPAGGIADFIIEIRNTGNGLDGIELDMTGYPPNWLFYITPPEVSLLQDEEGKSTIRVIVPFHFGLGPSEVNRLTVRAHSARSDVEEYLDIVLEIERFYRVEWFHRDEPVTFPEMPEAQPNTLLTGGVTINPYVQESYKFQLWVGNRGSSEANVTITASCSEPSVNIGLFPQVVRVLHRGQAYTVVTLGFPETVPSGTYTMYFNLTINEDPDFVTRVAPVRLTFFSYDVAMGQVLVTGTRLERNESGNLNTWVGNRITFKYWVEDLGSTPAEGVVVRLYHTAPNGTHMLLDENTIAEFGDDPVEFQFWWDATGVGVHTFDIELELADQSDTGNDRATVSLDVRRAPGGGGDAAIGPVEAIGILVLLMGVVLLAVAVRGVRVRPPPEE